MQDLRLVKFASHALLIALLALFFTLLFLPKATGVRFHEYAALFVTFLTAAHLYANSQTLRFLFRAKSAGLIYQNFIDFALMVSFFLTVVSGALISQYVFALLNLSDVMSARTIHVTASAYFLLFAALHAGTKLTTLFAMLKETVGSKIFKLILLLQIIPICNGISFFIADDFISKLSAQSSFSLWDFDKPWFYHFFNYLSLFVSVTFIGHLAYGTLLKIDRTNL